MEARIKAAGLRLTEPRRRILRILEAAQRPMAAEDILAASSGRTLDLVTVYRNMAAFAEHNLVQVLHLENGKQLFELKRGEHDHHHHIICRNCHNVVRLDLCFGSELEKYAREMGYKDVSHTFEVFGVCRDCAQ